MDNVGKSSFLESVNCLNKITKKSGCNSEALEKTENDIIVQAGQEYCKSPEDVKMAKTTRNIISRVEKQAGDILMEDQIGNITKIEKPDSAVFDIYTRFTQNIPITKKEKDYLLLFLQDEKALKFAQIMFSKFRLLQGDENNVFIKTYLKNENGKLDITKIIKYLIKELLNYELYFEGTNIQKIGKTYSFVLYSYTKNNEKYFFIIFNGKIHNIELTGVKILNNGLIFGIEDNKESQNGHLFTFDGKDFLEILKEPGIVDMEAISQNTIKAIDTKGKLGLVEITREKDENNEKEIKISAECLKTSCKEIYEEKGFIIGVNEFEKNNMKYDIYKEGKDGLHRIGNIVQNKGKEFNIENLGNNIIYISGNIYDLDEQTDTLQIIDNALLNINNVDLNNFIDGKPTQLNKDGVLNNVYIFDKQTKKLTLIMDTKKYGDIVKIINNTIITQINGKEYLYCWHNGDLYKPKKGYIYKEDNVGRITLLNQGGIWGFSRITHYLALHNLGTQDLEEYFELV